MGNGRPAGGASGSSVEAPYLLPDVVPAVRARFPKLQLVFREEKTDAVVANLRDGRLDVGLLALEADIGEWASGRVTDDPFVGALPMEHPLTRKKGTPAVPGSGTCFSQDRPLSGQP